MSRKIPHEVMRSLRSIAARMPKTKQPYSATVVLTGAEILEKKLDTKLVINEKKIYTKRKTYLRDVNHLTKLKKLWLREGNAGVEKYVRDMIEFNDQLKNIPSYL